MSANADLRIEVHRPHEELAAVERQDLAVQCRARRFHVNRVRAVGPLQRAGRSVVTVGGIDFVELDARFEQPTALDLYLPKTGSTSADARPLVSTLTRTPRARNDRRNSRLPLRYEVQGATRITDSRALSNCGLSCGIRFWERSFPGCSTLMGLSAVTSMRAALNETRPSRSSCESRLSRSAWA